MIELVAVVMAGVGTFAWLTCPWRKPIFIGRKELTCTGYQGQHLKVAFTDCVALRSHVCLDGRCTFHCAQMCRCASPFDTQAPSKGQNDE